jgi:hypothetical protein
MLPEFGTRIFLSSFSFIGFSLYLLSKGCVEMPLFILFALKDIAVYLQHAHNVFFWISN